MVFGKAYRPRDFYYRLSIIGRTLLAAFAEKYCLSTCRLLDQFCRIEALGRDIPSYLPLYLNRESLRYICFHWRTRRLLRRTCGGS
jgi:hypothetical protein